MPLSLAPYEGNEKEWDSFVMHGSINGTFLQTRKFINYHSSGRFNDCSLCIRKGQEMVGAVLACEMLEDENKIFYSHPGTTFGGITVSNKVYSTANIKEVFELLDGYFIEQGYTQVYMKTVPWIYNKRDSDLMDYYFHQNGYKCYSELNFFMHLERYTADILAPLSSSKRYGYRQALKNDLIFRELTTKTEIAEFHHVLDMNLKRLGAKVVHSIDDLYDLKFNRFPDNVLFYGVYKNDRLIAGSMVFKFENRVFHTQYLCSNPEYRNLMPMEYLITNLIRVSMEQRVSLFSFGICTEDRGRYLNMGLSSFKEGFGSEFCINRSYEKNYADIGK